MSYLLRNSWHRICLASMSSSPDPEIPTNCCQPGDITVTKIHSGYLLGRAMEQHGAKPWWEFISIVTTEAVALSTAKTLAASAGVKAWLHLSGDAYQPIPLDEPEA